jgi:hypothetical protein
LTALPGQGSVPHISKNEPRRPQMLYTLIMIAILAFAAGWKLIDLWENRKR